ncbi:MAG: hypothetical protein R6X14_08810 [bacterium]
MRGAGARAGLVLLLLFAGLLMVCRRPNRPPETAWSRGATAVVPGAAAVFVIVPFDPDGDSVRCELDWGDGTPLLKTGWHASLDTLRLSHGWADIGDYLVEFRLFDAREAAAPAERFPLVRCRPEIPPRAPELDSTWGPDRGFAGMRCWFGARAQDANGDHLRYQFDWGNGRVSEWSRWLRPGQLCRVGNSWAETGEYAVRVRCEDRTGLVTDWQPVVSLAMTLPPTLLWEVPLEEPVLAVPVAAPDSELVVADRGMVACYARSDGSLLGELLGPGSVLALASRDGDGVFVRDRDAFWGFTPVWRWQAAVEGLPLWPVVRPGRVFVPTRDTTWLLAAANGAREGFVAAPALNWISPLADRERRLVCLGDSLRRYRPDGTPDGSWRAPALVPDEFISAAGRFYGCNRLDSARTALQAFEPGGAGWTRLLGEAPSAGGPLTPVADEAGRVFFACRDSVSAFGPDGRLLWSWRPADGTVTSGTPCLGDAGELFVGVARAGRGAVVALDPQGRERWRVGLDCCAVLGMTLAADSVIYGTGTGAPALFAVRAGQGPAPGWPNFRHDAGGSGSAAP